MIEARGQVDDKQAVLSKLKSAQFIDKGAYICDDKIYTSSATPDSLDKGYILVRKFVEDNWPDGSTYFVAFRAPAPGGSRTLEKFHTNKEEEVALFLRKHPQLRFRFSYHKEGREFSKEQDRVYVEDIEHLGLSVEVESESENRLRELIENLEIKDLISEPLAPVMFKLVREKI